METQKPESYPIYNRFIDKTEIAGIVAAALPFVCNFSSTTSSTVNGQVTSYQQTDFAAIGLGLLAIGIALSTMRLWSNTDPNDLMKRRLVFVAVLALGAFQVVRGLGILTAI